MQGKNRYIYDGFQRRGRFQKIKDQSETSSLKVGNQSTHNAQIGEREDVPSIHGSYEALILHPKWKSRRKEILERDHHRCVVCKANKELQVHHRQYHFMTTNNRFKEPWDYPDHLLLALCIKCHTLGHSKFKVPIIKL